MIYHKSEGDSGDLLIDSWEFIAWGPRPNAIYINFNHSFTENKTTSAEPW